MSQKSQEFSPSFPYPELYEEDLREEIFQQVGSQDMNTLLNTDLGGDITNGPYANDIIYEHQIPLQDESTMSLEDIKHFPFSSIMASQLLPAPATDVLSNDEYLGPYDFDVSVLPNYKSKNPWVYSISLNKVYMDMNQQFPVDFKLKNRPDKALFIRTTPQYSAQHNAGEPVCRCIQHDHHADLTNKDIPDNVRQHVIRCANKYSQYVGNSRESQRLSIVFPLSMPQAGNESVRELFHFVCKSSCPAPGMNRRGIEVIFTLEDENGTVMGRKCLKVRICACPKRDKEKEENEANKTSNAAPRGKKRKTEHPPPANSGKVVAHQDDLKAYNLNMQFIGKQNLLDILSYAEKVYMSAAYQLQGHSDEQSLLKKNLAEIQAVKKQL